MHFKIWLTFKHVAKFRWVTWLAFGVCDICRVQENPFAGRICIVFSSKPGTMNFSEFLNMLSVFSASASRDIKSMYAFKIYGKPSYIYVCVADAHTVLLLRLTFALASSVWKQASLTQCTAGVLKRRTAVHNPDRGDVSGGPWQSPNLMQNPTCTNILLTY